MSSYFNFLIKLGVNAGSVEFIGGRLLGPLAWANSSNLGGYMNPNFIEGYTQLNAEITAALAKFKNYDVNARQQKNYYKKRSCLRQYFLGCKYKSLPKCRFARPDSKSIY